MIIRWTTQTVMREPQAYKREEGHRKTLWLLFLPPVLNHEMAMTENHYDSCSSF